MTCRMSLRRPRTVPRAENCSSMRPYDLPLGQSDAKNEEQADALGPGSLEDHLVGVASGTGTVFVGSHRPRQ